MSSGFSCGPCIVWVSNGTAEAFEYGWLEKLEKKTDEHAPAIIELLRVNIETSGPGMYGFDVIAPPLDVPAARHLLAVAIAEFATDCAAAVSGTRVVGPLAQECAGFEPFYQALWLANQERVHALVAGALEPAAPPLLLAVDAETRAAMDALKMREEIRNLFWTRGKAAQPEQHSLTELACRRAQRAKMVAAPRHFSPQYRRSMLYDLADLEEALGLYEDAAQSTILAAELEEDAATAEVARAIAANRAARASSA